MKAQLRTLWWLILTLPLQLGAQSDAADTSYVGPQAPVSLPALALHYYSINWTPAQWDTLRGREVELFFLIDQIGEPYLQTVRGIDEPDLIDSLQAATSRLRYFQPAREEGELVESVYGMYFTFPDRPLRERTKVQYATNWLGISFIPPGDLEREYAFSRFSLVVDYNLLFADYVGGPNEYIKPGGGFDLIFASRWSPQWGAGVAVGLDIAGLRKALPEDDLLRSDAQLANGYFAGCVDRVLHVSPQREWTVRGELGYGFLGISDDEDEQPDGNLSYGGLHTGLLVHYSNPFGQPGANGAARDARGRVQAQSFGYNFFAGLRYRYLGDRTGTGVYYFLGAGIRISGARYERLGR